MRLYEPDRHERPNGGDWSEAHARVAIERIVADTCRAFGDEHLWRIHPFDVSPERPASMKPLYYGAAGVIWALHHLSETGAVSAGPEFLPTVRDLVRRHHEDLRRSEALDAYLGRELASYLIGDVGVRMLQWKLEPSAALASDIHSALREKVGDSRGLLWGGAGSMLAALSMHAHTGESRWAERVVEHFEGLWNRWTWSAELGCWVWTEELYGVTETRLGALHGFTANAHAIVRCRHLLPADRCDEALARICETLRRTALIDGDRANWPHNVGTSNRPKPMPLLVQFCSGAPGVVACMADAARDDARVRIDGLLLQAGELIWQAGPQTKLPVFCHGAVGNGYAFLKLHRMTGDRTWLARARAFAVHGIDRAERALATYGQRKFSLWTGDLGLAVYLWDCVRESATLPTLDYF